MSVPSRWDVRPAETTTAAEAPTTTTAFNKAYELPPMRDDFSRLECAAYARKVGQIIDNQLSVAVHSHFVFTSTYSASRAGMQSEQYSAEEKAAMQDWNGAAVLRRLDLGNMRQSFLFTPKPKHVEELEALRSALGSDQVTFENLFYIKSRLPALNPIISGYRKQAKMDKPVANRRLPDMKYAEYESLCAITSRLAARIQALALEEQATMRIYGKGVAKMATLKAILYGLETNNPVDPKELPENVNRAVSGLPLITDNINFGMKGKKRPGSDISDEPDPKRFQAAEETEMPPVVAPVDVGVQNMEMAGVSKQLYRKFAQAFTTGDLYDRAAYAQRLTDIMMDTGSYTEKYRRATRLRQFRKTFKDSSMISIGRGHSPAFSALVVAWNTIAQAVSPGSSAFYDENQNECLIRVICGYLCVQGVFWGGLQVTPSEHVTKLEQQGADVQDPVTGEPRSDVRGLLSRLGLTVPVKMGEAPPREKPEASSSS